MYGNISFASKDFDVRIELEEGDSIATVTRTKDTQQNISIQY